MYSVCNVTRTTAFIFLLSKCAIHNKLTAASQMTMEQLYVMAYGSVHLLLTIKTVISVVAILMN